QKMLSGADSLLALVNDLLDMSRIQAGKFHLDPQVVYFQDIATEVVGSLSPLAERKHQLLTNAISDELPVLVADRQRVAQILVNLVNNAIKFTPEHGAITLRARIEHDALRCEVIDTGIGIAREDMGKLFRPFSQIDASSTRSASGTGLGLSIVKALVQAHGGQVGVDSAKDAGSTFWFTLPLTQEDC
ncbi:MAG TPA: ATP-binding protein, partial [Oscillatoriaceae cyanobacterium]